MKAGGEEDGQEDRAQRRGDQDHDRRGSAQALYLVEPSGRSVAGLGPAEEGGRVGHLVACRRARVEEGQRDRRNLVGWHGTVRHSHTAEFEGLEELGAEAEPTPANVEAFVEAHSAAKAREEVGRQTDIDELAAALDRRIAEAP